MSISGNIKTIQDKIRETAKRCQRDPDGITLIAVSKKQPIEKIKAAIQAGQKHFGESYVQEALPKITALTSPSLCWHFIGPIQSNKTQWIAENFQWVHSVDRIKIAERLDKQRSPFLPPLHVCIEINIDQEDTKSGITEANIVPLAQAIVGCPRLKLCGLMAIPKFYDTLEEQRGVFQRIKRIFDRLNQKGFALDTLSMGMSHDFQAAILEGATHVRIGTAIFGERSD